MTGLGWRLFGATRRKDNKIGGFVEDSSGNSPWWINIIAAPVMAILIVIEFFTYPKIKCPKCGKKTSINSERFCKRCLENY